MNFIALFGIFICRFFFVVSLVGLTNYFLYSCLLTSNIQFGEKKKPKPKKKNNTTILNEKKENLFRKSKSRKDKKKRVNLYIRIDYAKSEEVANIGSYSRSL